MKTQLTLAALAALGLALPAYAQPGPGGPRGDQGGPMGGPGPHHQEMLEKYDENNDGMLSEEEKAEAHEAFTAKLKEEHPEKFEKLDKDSDGELSKEEMRAAYSKRGHMGFGRHGDRQPPTAEEVRQNAEEQFDELDANNDGQISQEEFVTASVDRFEQMKQRHEQRREQFMERYDTNNDGELSDEERQAVREQMPQRRGPRAGGPGAPAADAQPGDES